MFKKSIGLIETIGLASGIVAADSAVKSANVELIGYELSKGSGMTTVKIAGDVGAVNAAVSSAIAAVDSIGGKVYSSKVIPRLGENVEKIIYTKDTVGIEKEPEKKVEVKKEVEEVVEVVEVKEEKVVELVPEKVEEVVLAPKVEKTEVEEKPKEVETEKKPNTTQSKKKKNNKK